MPVQLEIGIPGAGTTNFATTPIPSVTLTKTPSGDILSSRSPINNAILTSRSNWGTAAIVASAYETKYQWQVSAIITDAQKLILTALARWQDDNPTTGLRLVDQVEYLDPVDTQSRTLLSTLNPDWNAGYEYGYGVFSVYLDITPDSIQRFAAYNNGLWLAQFRMEEL
jgi:hypothetical protein